ncbi:exonuclease III [compost metagenome]|uniref:endonuclease/exonuclease/phosphatase family protein n=1 Tax=Pedobacter sp. ok626 TaxID=1761882 RepID=UPI0008800147|nr:endonuclease/exonuclease/phosphatase family protein [Pedobacter sp. ok626]SDL97647.1 exodeoxyribonuclease-3 [Pedobacter sp. ok626]
MKTLYRKISMFLFLLLMGSGSMILAQNKTRIISYNILEGMKSDTTKGKQDFVKWLKSENPDILALQECNKFTQKSLEDLARSYGHTYAVLLREPGYPVALTSKYPIVDVQKVTDNMHHGFIVAKIKDLNVIVLHLSPHKYWKRREEIDVILSTISASAQKERWIIMGDFNSLSPLDKDNYADGKYADRLKEMAKKYSFHENLVDGKYLDFEVQKRILEFGLHDTAKEKATGNETKGNRIDYIYVSKDLMPLVTKAQFIRDEFTATHSDHVPVIMEFKDKK